MDKKNLDKIDWKGIIDNLSDSVFVLGPGALVNDKGKSCHEYICQYHWEKWCKIEAKNSQDDLAASLNKSQLPQEQIDKILADSLASREAAINAKIAKQPMKLGDDLYFELNSKLESKDAVNWKKHRNEIVQQMNDFQLHPIFKEKFPRIPFQALISFSPDKLLARGFFEAEFPLQTAYHDYRGQSSSTTVETWYSARAKSKERLLFQMFGYCEEEDSMILTYERLYEYIFAVMGNGDGKGKLPEKISRTISETPNLVLLGFDFDSWYLKLLLRVFKIHERRNKGDKGIPVFAAPVQYNEDESLGFFSDNFSITFVASNAVGFLDELYIRCEKEQKLLDKADVPWGIEGLKALFKQNRMDDFFNRFEDYLKEKKDPDTGNLLIEFQNRWVNNQEKDKIGSADSRDINTERISILESLNKLIAQCEKDD